MQRYIAICHGYSLHRLSKEMYSGAFVFYVLSWSACIVYCYFASMHGNCVVLLFQTLAMHWGSNPNGMHTNQKITG